MSEIVTGADSAAKPEFLDQVRSILRTRHDSLRTEEADPECFNPLPNPHATLDSLHRG